VKNKFPAEKTFKILLIEDDGSASSLMKESLVREGYIVNAIDRGEGAFEEIQYSMPDLVILDMDLPDLTGWEVLRLVRSDKSLHSIPIIAVSGKYVQSLHTVRALSDFGADDYVQKPFGREIFVSRVKALLRRRGWDTDAGLRVIKEGPIRIDVSSRQMFIKGRAVALTKCEFGILTELIRNKGAALERSYLMERLIGYSSPCAETRSVDKHVESLRRKLKDCSGRLMTVRDVGYKFFILFFLIAAFYPCAVSAGVADVRRLASLVIKRPSDASARGKLDCVLREMISEAAISNAEEAERIMDCASSRINGIYTRAVDDFNGGRLLFAHDGFKSMIAVKPSCARAVKYMTRIYSQMSGLSGCEVAADAEMLAYAKAFIYYNSGELVNAVAEWERALGLNPSNGEVKQYLEKTRRFLKELIERERFARLKSMILGLFESAAADYGAGEYEKAIGKWEKVVAVSEREKSGFFAELGERSRKMISSSLEKVSKKKAGGKEDVPEKDASASDKYYKEGLELYSLGHIRDALSRWGLSVRFNPGNGRAKRAIENAQKEIGRE
jgi:two-component system alkaline phosphatase synthesis response regulator PhoP